MLTRASVWFQCPKAGRMMSPRYPWASQTGVAMRRGLSNERLGFDVGSPPGTLGSSTSVRCGRGAAGARWVDLPSVAGEGV